tara:strand:- start:50659 stop:51282 length:624 start_codon:yes stop_codon:yes gene_type:complete
MAKQKYKGKTLYTKTCVDNVVQLAMESNPDDRNWYQDAYNFALELSYQYNVGVQRVVGIIAALSPMKSWDENKRLAEEYLKGNRYGTYGTLLGKADDIMYLEHDNVSDENILDILNGQKISAFYLNINHYQKSTTVTVDRHAVEIAMDTILDNHQMTAKQYAFFQNVYIIASDKLGYLPHELQAVTWVSWRMLKHPNQVTPDTALPF